MLTWQRRDADEKHIQNLIQELHVSPVLARLLVNRKITTPVAAARFFSGELTQMHAPNLLRDMDKAVTRLAQALANHEKICVYGDYDVDGAVATAMLVLFFEELGQSVDFYIPNRLSEGYSLHTKAIDHLKKQGVRVIVTVDNGIMAHAAIAYARAQSLDVIVTDHHHVGETLPDAVAIVNPQRADCAYPFKGICGAGVAFKLMVALRQHLRQNGFFKTEASPPRVEPNLKSYFDLLCIPTVCDVVPLVDENRIFVKEGLKHLMNTKRLGLKALLTVCGLDDRAVTASDLGFKLGPRINACGRLEDASLGVRLLVSRDAAEALMLAKRLDALNLERRELERDMTDQAFAKIQANGDWQNKLGLVLFEPDWHIGVVGIVASRLAEKTKRPVIVLAMAENGLVKGSGRTASGVSLIAALTACADVLTAFGGHEAAAGVTLTSERIADFTRVFDEAVQKQITPTALTKPLWVDDELNAMQIDDALIDELSVLEPHGSANAKPLFVLRDGCVVSQRVVGENHLKLTLKAGDKIFDAIAFNTASLPTQATQNLGVVFGIEHNHFRGEKKLQLIVKTFF